MSDPVNRLRAALADRYTIERELGAGGMATVYLAADLKHDRQVAVKVLRPELAAVLGAERFVQEIKTTASLQHPHILPLFDSGEADGFLFYVMPYIEGETVRDKLDRETQLGVDEAVKITTEVADALDYAHRHNVIHRDIKPENILLHDGRPMVADFGIALAVSAAAGGRMTETGMSLGTPHYMSPEQATADKDLSNRSDIYSLGAVLYEMLTGNPPHVGSSAQQIIMRIVTDDVRPVTEVRKAVPSNVAAAVSQALEKLPADRFASARAFADALGDPSFAGTTAGVTARAATALPDWRSRFAVPLAVLATASTLGLAWMVLRPPLPSVPTVHRFVVSLDGDRTPPDEFPSLALSPDGLTIVYIRSSDDGRTQLWVRRSDEIVGRPIQGSENGVAPTVSPDGETVAWVRRATASGGTLMTAPLAGGAPRAAAERVEIVGLAWGPDGSLYYPDPSGLRRLTPDGTVENVTSVDRTAGELVHALPNVLPNNTGALFTITGLRQSALVRFSTGEIVKLESVGTGARYVPSGHLVWATSNGELMAARFDPGADRMLGPPVVMTDGLWIAESFLYDLSISDNGTMIYRKGASIALATPVWVDRAGREEPVEPGWRFDPDGANAALALSPSATQMVVTIGGSRTDLWTKTFASGAVNRITFEGNLNFRPFWLPDRRTIGYLSGADGSWKVMRKAADGTGSSTVLLELDEDVQEANVSPDGNWFVYRVGSGTGNRDVYAVRLDDDSNEAPVPLATSEAGERAVTVSPNGRWLAYVSDESGRDEIYVRPFPNAADGRWQISTTGGLEPRWARSGDELFYRNGAGDLVAVSVTADDTFSVGTATTLFSAIPYLSDYNHWLYDVTPDGQRFLMLRDLANNESEVVWVSNWFEELKRRTGTNE